MSSSLNVKMMSVGYQGSFSEVVSEFELNYNEFDLRTYDPQIGRWTGSDPYDEFPSPYIGLGNDPVNNVDPSGGFTGMFAGMSQFGKTLTMTLGGAIVGGAVDALAGGDGWTGAAIGAALGFGGSFMSGMSTLQVATTITSSFAIAGSLMTSNASGGAGSFGNWSAASGAVGGGTRYSTPDGGTIIVPELATDLTFYDASGTGYFVDYPNAFKVVPGSLKSFTFKGKNYTAMFYYSDGTFAKYGWDSSPATGFDELSYDHPKVVKTTLHVRAPSAEDARTAGQMGVTAMPGTLREKAVAGLIMGTLGLLLKMVYFETVVFDFQMTAPGQPFDGGYLKSEDNVDHLRGGGQNERDASIKQYPKDFQRWYHRDYKQPGDPDATKEELKQIYEEWESLGRPTVK